MPVGVDKSADNIAPPQRPYPKQIATRKEMFDAQLPLSSRDPCAHLLIPLNHCRHETIYAPWKCGDERHSYEQCAHKLYLFRAREMQLRRKAAAAENTK